MRRIRVIDVIIVLNFVLTGVIGIGVLRLWQREAAPIAMSPPAAPVGDALLRLTSAPHAPGLSARPMPGPPSLPVAPVPAGPRGPAAIPQR